MGGYLIFGLRQYFRMFIAGFEDSEKPLSQLMKGRWVVVVVSRSRSCLLVPKGVVYGTHPKKPAVR
jgi:hypothetical protein